MVKLKTGEVKSQIHIYSSEKEYQDFKKEIKKVNYQYEKEYTVSSILRDCMNLFGNSEEFQQIIINGGVIE